MHLPALVKDQCAACAAKCTTTSATESMFDSFQRDAYEFADWASDTAEKLSHEVKVSQATVDRIQISFGLPRKDSAKFG